MKKIKTLIILLIILLLIGGGVFAFLLLKTDLLLTNQQAFYKYLAQEEVVLNNLFAFYEAQEVKEDIYSSNAEIELNVEGDEEKISAGASINTKKNGENTFSGVELIYQNKEFISLNYLKEEDKHGIQFPGIKQYVVLENNNLKDFIKKLGLEDEEVIKFIPNKISSIYPNDLIELTEQEKEQIKNLVINSLGNNILEERYIKEKVDNLTVNGQKITATGYSVQLTEKDMLNVSKSILEEIKSNEIILKMIENKIDYIMYSEEIDIFTGFIRTIIFSNIQLENGLLQKAGSEERANIEITRENIIETIEDYVDDLKDEIENFNDEEKNNIKIIAYQKGGKTVKIKLEQNQEKEVYNNYSDDGAETSIITNIIELDNIENTEKKSHVLVTILNYIDGELEEGQTTQIIIEKENEKSILKEQVQDVKEEDTKTTSEVVITKVGKTTKIEGNATSTQDEVSTNIKYTNTIQIGDATISEKFEDNEIVLNKLSIEKIQTIFTKIKEILESKIQKTFPEFTFGEGGSTLDLIERAEEASQSMNELEIATFNTKFKQYEGEDVRATIVRSLKDQVDANNAAMDHKVTLEGAENIESSKTYSIESFDTDDDGFIDKIVVEEN